MPIGGNVIADLTVRIASDITDAVGGINTVDEKIKRLGGQ